MAVLSEQIAMLDHAAPLELRGTVTQVRGLALHVVDLPAPIGAMVRINRSGGDQRSVNGEVVGFDKKQTLVVPLGEVSGIRSGDRVTALQHAQVVHVGSGLLGRVLNGLGDPIDGLGPVADLVAHPLCPDPVDPLKRPLIGDQLATGVRAVDALIALGRGQRVGVFSAPGVGKSTLLGMMARQTAADAAVIALIGERGREVRDFVDNTLGADGLARSVVVCATGDEPALLRVRAALVASSIAESFRDDGLDVLLIMDSVTRFCQAQRQVGLAAGEPPVTKGYPPSVFAMLPRLLERSGRTPRGSITGLYSVLVEGDDLTDPVADACRGVLDGHIQLSRRLAEQGHYPAIDVLGSISRVADDVTGADQRAARLDVMKMISAYQQVEELLNIGAYAPGSNAEFDLAIACKPAVDQLLQQGRGELNGHGDAARVKAQLLALVQHIEQTKRQVAKPQARSAPLPMG